MLAQCLDALSRSSAKPLECLVVDDGSADGNLRHCYTHRAGHGEVSRFWSVCGAFRRKTFLRHGVFDERYNRPAIEDIEFGVRLKSVGGRILLDAAIQVQHLKCWTFAS